MAAVLHILGNTIFYRAHIMKDKSLKKRVLAWFILTLFILGVVAGLVARSFYEIKQQQAWVEHTYLVIGGLQDTISNVKDVQSSQRGFAITGHEDYLSPYYSALPNIDKDLANLHVLLKDNTEQAKRLATLEERVRARIAIADKVIDTYKRKGEAATFAMIRSGTGKREMDLIRETTAEMIAEEERLLEGRRASSERAMEITSQLGAAGLAICALILAFVFWLVRREMTRRAEIEEKLYTSLAEMEQISQESELINKLGDFLQSCQTLDEAFGMLAHHIPPLLPGTHGAVHLLNNSHNFLERVTSWGDNHDTMAEFEPDQCWCMRRGTAHAVEKDGTNPVCDHIKQVAEGGSICLPMLAHGETIGMFFVAGNALDSLSQRRQTLVRTLSEQTSLAIANLRLQDKLRQQSVRDPLTQLFNRRYLQETLEREISRAKRNRLQLCVLVLDIDHFKKFNDTFGHDAGDALLTHFGRMLTANVRAEDIVCRYGGEEFVVVLPDTNAQNALARAKMLCALTRKLSIKMDKQTLGDITVSIGLAMYPDDGMTPEQLFTLADEALYRAKHNGRDQVVVAAE